MEERLAKLKALVEEATESANRNERAYQIKGKGIRYAEFELASDHLQLISELITKAEDSQAQITFLQEGLRESLKLQSHYATTLNMYDCGKRQTFNTWQEWLDSIARLKVRLAAKKDQA